MTRYAFIADLHLWNHRAFGGTVTAGLNARAREGLDVLRRACAAAREAHCSRLFILGDLFEGVDPKPQMIAAVQRILHESGLDVRILAGNHERVSMADGDHALGPVGPPSQSKVGVYEKPTLFEFPSPEPLVVALPHTPGFGAGAFAEALEMLAKGAARGVLTSAPRRLLVMHHGIAGGGTPGYLSGDGIPIDVVWEVARRHGFAAVLAGDWHRHRVYSDAAVDCVAIQLGALVPHDWRDEGMEDYGRVVIYDSTENLIDIVEVPGPRFVLARDAQAAHDAVGAAGKAGHHLYLRYVRQSDAAPFEAPEGVECENEVDTEEAEIAARSAAMAAKGAGTLEGAVESYVAEMPLDEGVDRAAVLARVQGYLRCGKAVA